MFENKATSVGIFYTRYIMSWIRVGGTIPKRGPLEPFETWLRSLGHLTEEEIRDIKNLATEGKMELESNAKKFLKEYEE